MASESVPVTGPRVNERVDYHSPFRIGIFDAVVIAVNPDGTVALDVYLPGAAGPRFDTEPAVRLRAVSYGPKGRARPRA